MKAGHTEEYVDETSAAPWPQLDGVRPNTSPALVDDVRRSEDGEGRGGAKYNTPTVIILGINSIHRHRGVVLRVHGRVSSANSVRSAIRGLRRSADRLRRVLAVSVTTTTLATVIARQEFVGVLTTLRDLTATSVCLGSTETPSLVVQVMWNAFSISNLSINTGPPKKLL